MKNLTLTICVFLMACFYAPAQDVAEVPFVIEEGNMVVEIKVKKELMLRMAVSFSLPSSYDMMKLKKAGIEYPAMMAPQGLTDKFTPMSEVSDFYLGGLKSEGVNMYWDADNDLLPRPKKRLDGVLGFNFFSGSYMKRIIQIDYEKSVMRFFKKAPQISSTPIKFSARVSESNLKDRMLIAFDDFEAAGKKMKAGLDLGHPGELILAATPDGCKRGETPEQNACENIKLGTFTKEKAGFTIEPPQAENKKTIATLGRGLFAGKLITINFKEKLIFFE